MFGGFGQQSTTAQPGAFGASSTQPAGSAGGSSSLFGGAQGAPSGSSPFGSTTGSTSGAQPAAGGGLFGQPGQAGAQATGGSSLFGGGGTGAAGAGTQPTSSLFGQPSTSQATGGGLFGGWGTTTGQPSLFGGGTGPTAGGGSTAGTGFFGQSTTGQPAAGTSSLFGGSTLGQPSTTTNPLFGGSTTQSTNPLFGGSTTSTAQPSSSLFGGLGTSMAPKPSGGSLFGGAAGAPAAGTSTAAPGSLFGSTASKTTTALPQQQAADAQAQYITLVQRIEGIKNAWDPNSPQCRFKHFFYNVVDPNEVARYGRPANATDEGMWQKALRENPDPSSHVPVLAVGFDDLQKRVEAQAQQALAQQEKLKELKKYAEALAQRHEGSNAARLQRAAAVHAQLSHRIINVVRRLHLLIPALRNSAIRPEEEQLRAMLDRIEEEVKRPGGLGRVRGKLNELWAQIGQLNAALERDGQVRVDGRVQWAVVDEEGLEQIAQVLADQQNGLAHLTRVLQKDGKDLDIIEGKSVREETAFTSSLPATLNLSSTRR